MPRKVRIQSNGESFFNGDSSIVDVETGEQNPIPEVAGIDISMNPKGVTAVITVFRPQIDVVVDATIVGCCSYCGKKGE